MGAQLFSSLDLAFGHWQMHVKVDDGLDCISSLIRHIPMESHALRIDKWT